MQKDENDVLQPIEWLSKSFEFTQLNRSIREREYVFWEVPLEPNGILSNEVRPRGGTADGCAGPQMQK